jgi:hypothetical protein
LEEGALVHERIGNLALCRVHRLDGELRPVADIFARARGIYGEVFGMSEKDGGPAFPWPGDITAGRGGMTLRDYFAAQAPIDQSQAIFALRRSVDFGSMKDVAFFMSYWTKLRYEYADAMLEARKR